MKVLWREGVKMRELTVRSTETPGIGKVKCPKSQGYCLVSQCHLCDHYVDEGLRIKKGQQYVLCSHEKKAWKRDCV